MRFILLLLAGLVAAGCQTTSDLDGSGPIELSYSNRALFDRYLKERRPLAFAVAVDGRSGASYQYCPDLACGSETTAPYRAIQSCEQQSNGVACKLFARKWKIVWEGYTGDAGDERAKREHCLKRTAHAAELTDRISLLLGQLSFGPDEREDCQEQHGRR